MGKRLQYFDNKYTGLIRDLPESYRPYMNGVTVVGEPYIVIPVSIAAYLVALHNGRRDIQLAFVYAVVAYGINSIVKILLHRARPHGLIVKTLGIKSYSFPSGHAFGTVIFYGLIAYIDTVYHSGPTSLLLVALITCLIALIGISRVYLGSHYPSDVIAGWLAGMVSLVIIITLAF